jgi:hypothetical protein
MSSPEELEEMIRHLQTKMVYLEGRITLLENKRYPNLSMEAWPSVDSIKCVKCGLVLSPTAVVSFNCAQMHCPIQTKSTC